MMKLFSVFLFALLAIPASANMDNNNPKSVNVNLPAGVNTHVKLSIELLESVKNNDASKREKVLKQIANISLDDLVSSLDTKQKKLAFWVNMYNAFVQIELIANPLLFENKKSFYKEQRHNIAGVKMSYDNIEHGILRNSRVKLSLGYIKRIFVDKWERRLRNKDIDGRIHFALNCGALSCPPVAIFNDVEVEGQLDKVNKLYLEEYTSIEGNTINTTPLFSWFRGDFGGKKSVDEFLARYGVIPDEGTKYELNFIAYDWTLLTGNFIDLTDYPLVDK